MRCKIERYVVMSDLASARGIAGTRCNTHDWDFGGQQVGFRQDGNELCPLGRIEEAVENGRELIGGIVEKYLKEALSESERAEAERRRRLAIEEEMELMSIRLPKKS